MTPEVIRLLGAVKEAQRQLDQYRDNCLHQSMSRLHLSNSESDGYSRALGLRYVDVVCDDCGKIKREYDI
jgi:hypothetical protein